MAETHDTIIRACPEHLCRLYALHRIEERAEAGEFRIEVTPNKKKPFVDHKGVECIWTDVMRVMDDRYPVGDIRHEVTKALRHRAADGTIGASGRWDPKAIMVNGVVYHKYQTKGGRVPRCEICESGDMIFPWKRFYSSEYKPSTMRCGWVRIRATLRRLVVHPPATLSVLFLFS